VTAFEALNVMRVAMRGQFSDELLREFIKLLGGLNAAAASMEGTDLTGLMRVAG
jgi:hypothetical protein